MGQTAPKRTKGKMQGKTPGTRSEGWVEPHPPSDTPAAEANQTRKVPANERAKSEPLVVPPLTACKHAKTGNTTNNPKEESHLEAGKCQLEKRTLMAPEKKMRLTSTKCHKTGQFLNPRGHNLGNRQPSN